MDNPESSVVSQEDTTKTDAQRPAEQAGSTNLNQSTIADLTRQYNDANLERVHDERIKRAVEEESDVFKAFCRSNIRWLMAEIDHTREGRSEVERASLNP